MALTFPQNPSNSQIYNQYIFDSVSGTWKVYDNESGLLDVLATKANLSGGNTFSGTQSFTSGLISAASSPSFRAYRSSDINGFNASSQTNPVIFNATVYNVGNHYNTSTGRFTAPISGRYVFFAGIFSNVNAEQVWPIINGVREQSLVVLSGYQNITGAGVFYLNANDTFAVTPWANGNTNFTIYSNTYHTYLHGAYIG
jgi:hypothetical protein